ncbi:MAG: hypothetical protein QMD09_15500, partial [Desulfatibacillaceae bacterium]|nr:hypothetical protein [Desulfatibacillaceae bacterium]
MQTFKGWIDKFMEHILLHFLLQGVLAIGSLGGLLYNLFSGQDLTNWILVALLSVALVYLTLTLLYFRRLNKLRASGVISLKEGISPDNGPSIWRKAQNDLMYLGVTAHSIHRQLIDFIQKDSNASRRYRLLLINPNSEAFRRFVGYSEKGNPAAFAGPEGINAKEVKSTASEMLAAVDRIMGLVQERGEQLSISIRFYDEFVPYWLYRVDNAKCFVGALKKSDSNKMGALVQ